MRITVAITLILVVCRPGAFAQEEDEKCSFPTDKKIIKMLQEAHNKKYDDKKQYQFLKDALKEDPDCAECKYLLGMRSYNNATQRGSSYEYAIGYFTDLIGQCPKYHADPYYYLGVMHYSDNDKAEALKYFRLFLEFKSPRSEAYPEDFPKKKHDVQEVIPEIEFNEEFFKNPVPFEPRKVQHICTDADEYLPMLSPDNELIFFTRVADRANKGDIRTTKVEEFSLAVRNDITGPFDAGTPLPKPFNVGPNYGGSTISLDNKEIIICACEMTNVNTPREYKNCDLYSAHYERYFDEKFKKYMYRWSDMVNLGPKINTTNGWEAQPSLSSDGKTLFYASIRPNADGLQQSDIYCAERNEDGTWGLGRPLGPEINTDLHEKTPFIHSDSKTLYFSAQSGTKHLGAGGYDIFYTRMDAKGKWSKPKNLGYPINTDKDEVGLIVSSDGKLAYYASNSLAGARGYDIFAFDLYQEARPDRVTIVKGELKDLKGVPVTHAVVEVKSASTGEITKAVVDTVDGKFVAAVTTYSEEPEELVVTVKKEGHSFASKLISVDKESAPAVKGIELEVDKIEKGKSYTINDILFETGSAELNTASKFVIDQFVDFLKENANVKVEIRGHTDNVGDPAKNLVLSNDRAKSVMDYILSRGISANRLTYKGYGESKPKVANNSDANKAKNRRTEFFITET